MRFSFLRASPFDHTMRTLVVDSGQIGKPMRRVERGGGRGRGRDSTGILDSVLYLSPAMIRGSSDCL